MTVFGNLIWLIFGGLLTGLGYIIGGLAMCLTIVGIPFGIQSINLGMATFAPFGKEVVAEPHGDGFLRLVFDIIWIVLFGWEIAVAHAIAGLIFFVTIVGIPFGTQHFKLIPVALFPFSYSLK